MSTRSAAQNAKRILHGANWLPFTILKFDTWRTLKQDHNERKMASQFLEYWLRRNRDFQAVSSTAVQCFVFLWWDRACTNTLSNDRKGDWNEMWRVKAEAGVDNFYNAGSQSRDKASIDPRNTFFRGTVDNRSVCHFSVSDESVRLVWVGRWWNDSV